MIRSARQAVTLGRLLLVIGMILAFGAIKLPAEHALFMQRRQLHFRAIPLNLGLREQIGQLSFVAALSGFRAIVADALFIQAYVAWERTEWGRVLFLFRQVTTLQPRSILFWDMAAWHMGWNASVAALKDRTQPRLALRIKAEREYFALAKDFLERGIKNNPDKPQLYESLARLYQQKYKDHERASEYYAKAASLPGAPGYDKRFAAYELSYCPGHESEAYERLHQLYEMGEKERLPTLIARLKVLEKKLNIPQEQRIRDSGR
jgi:tetratricopeptide (TPR) repeat protein